MVYANDEATLRALKDHATIIAIEMISVVTQEKRHPELGATSRFRSLDNTPYSNRNDLGNGFATWST